MKAGMVLYDDLYGLKKKIDASGFLPSFTEQAVNQKTVFGILDFVQRHIEKIIEENRDMRKSNLYVRFTAWSTSDYAGGFNVDIAEHVMVGRITVWEA